MTTSINNLVKRAGGKQLSYPILTDGTADINQGDLLYWDSSAKVVKVLASNTNALTFVGVAAKASYVNLYGTKKYEGSMEVVVGEIHEFNTIAGQTYAHLDALYYSTDAQSVTPTDPGSGNVIGYVQLRDGQSAIAGASGVKVDVLTVAKSPAVLA